MELCKSSLELGEKRKNMRSIATFTNLRQLATSIVRTTIGEGFLRKKPWIYRLER